MAKTLTGIVASDRADKSIVVVISTRKTHPIYKKQYSVSKKIMAHDEQNDAKIGDTVVIAETKPISARKRFTLEKVVERAAIRHEEPEVIVAPVKKESVKAAAKKPVAAKSKEEPETTV